MVRDNADGSDAEMPLARYFVFVGGVLLALLLLIDEILPKLPDAERAETTANKAVLRIRSDQKWPERVVFDTSLPTIVPARTANAEAPIAPPTTIAGVSAKAGALRSFAELRPPETKTPEPKPQRKRKIARPHIAPPIVVVAQQPRFGFFDNGTW